MKWYKTTLEIRTRGKGLYAFTPAVQQTIRSWDIQEGMCFLSIQHTSASLVIGENYDSTAQSDMEAFLERLIPENLPWYRHTLEGPDDSSAHLRALITPTSQNIPIEQRELCLGTWQGIYLFEHRSVPHQRQVLLRCLAVEASESMG